MQQELLLWRCQIFWINYPDVTVSIAMIGGSIPFVAEQIQFAQEAAGQKDTTDRLRRIYYDTGQFGRGPHNIAHTAKVSRRTNPIWIGQWAAEFYRALRRSG